MKRTATAMAAAACGWTAAAASQGSDTPLPVQPSTGPHAWRLSTRSKGAETDNAGQQREDGQRTAVATVSTADRAGEGCRGGWWRKAGGTSVDRECGG